jgi:preprotein translocase subunit YajC
MSFFVSDAFAQGAPAAGGDPWAGLLFPIALIAIFYFLLIRPQTKRAKEHKKMIEAIAKGDEVVTQGGVLGRVTEVGDNFLNVEIANGLEIKVQKNAISALMPKGTYRQPEKKAVK